MKRLKFHVQAKAEFKESAKWYEAQKSGLGVDFWLEVQASLRRIAANPEGFGFVRGGKRMCRVNRFPYGIVFDVLPDRVFVIAVMHLKRDPDYWVDRS